LLAIVDVGSCCVPAYDASLFVEDGVVRGVYVSDTTASESAEPQLIRARRGVILASGGFEQNEQMRVKYQRAPITTEWTVGAKANTGDGIIAACPCPACGNRSASRRRTGGRRG